MELHLYVISVSIQPVLNGLDESLHTCLSLQKMQFNFKKIFPYFYYCNKIFYEFGEPYLLKTMFSLSDSFL
jgi:hypothetical protein